MEIIEFGNTYMLANTVNTSWVGIVDVVDNIANVQIGNSEISISVPITTTDVIQDIKTFFNISND